MQTTLTLLSPPRNQKALILKRLIDGEMISERDTVYNGFRTRISELRLDHNVPIRFNWKPFKNEFGHEGKYKVHYILSVDKELCEKIYETINK
jgi:hypothetical protein